MTIGNRLFVYVWSGGFIIGGLFFGGLGCVWAWEAMESGSWPSTEGKVIDSRVNREETRDSDGDRKIRYRPIVVYEFRVDGRTYSGNRLQIGSLGYKKHSAASAAIKERTRENQCTVFYNPKDPAQSSLTAGLQLSHFLFPGLGMVLFLVGFFGGWLMISQSKKRQNTSKKHHHNPPDTGAQVPVATMPKPKAPDHFGPRGDTLQQNITSWGREHIGTGDDTLIDWYMHSSFDDGHLSFVEVEPFPKEVGYDKFIFVVSFEQQPADLIATYCFEDGEFFMFSSNANDHHNLPAKLPSR